MAPKKRERSSAQGEARAAEAAAPAAPARRADAAEVPAAAAAAASPPPHMLNRFVVRCMMRDIDPAFHVTDAGAEAMLEGLDAFLAQTVAHATALAVARQRERPAATGAAVTTEDIETSMLQLFDV
jgi:hypothetical protein